MFHLLLTIAMLSGIPTNAGHLKRLERLHSHFSLFDSTSSSEFYLTLAEHHRFYASTQICRILNKLSPSYLHSIPSDMLFLSQVAMFIGCIYVPAVNLNYGKHSQYIVVRPSGTVCLPQSLKLFHQIASLASLFEMYACYTHCL